ncbi:MAG: sulfur oxidation c-type cytochrome SoxX [Burkholderiaceae bacterium]|jgi:sulfur-oxidizing protein SoxX|nr:sulfur oxidation c-type cytochrome SoxX [Burkholderiaceae bacterium]
MHKTMKIAAAVAAAAALAGCASMMYTPPTEQETLAVIKAGFHERGIAKLDRLNQTDLQRACTETKNNPPKEVRERLEKAALAAVRYPADGKWLGDWKQGERIAQSGVGMQWTDRPDTVNGGNCYACHQISKEEISFGNIGPTLYNYGKLRGNSEPIMRYTWAKIWNTHAFNACSSMPRFGDAGILTEDQIRHVMALLLDPQSPVNK